MYMLHWYFLSFFTAEKEAFEKFLVGGSIYFWTTRFCKEFNDKSKIIPEK